jgi:dTDP-4-amino-4,6-dideoxygalactose transaminase
MVENLALHGGERVTREAFPAWPHLCEKSLADALDTLRSGHLSYLAGRAGPEFEQKWAAWAGSRHAICCSSGTAALHLTLLGLGVGPGDEVIVPSHSFIATASAAALAGATPVFCDVAEDHTLDWRAAARLLAGRTKAIIAVHLYGAVCDLGPLVDAARARGIAVVEDCAQCVGGEYRGRKAGTVGVAGCFSFFQTKHLTTAGEGGMIVTDDDRLAAAVRSLRDHGRGEPVEPQAAGGPHERLGLNYRLTEVQSAVGLAELARLETWNLPRRTGFARMYDHAFRQLPGVHALPYTSETRRNAYWQYPLQLSMDHLTCPVEKVQEALSAEGIPCSLFQWRQSYEEPLFGGGRDHLCPTAEKLARRTLVLFLHPTWEKSHIECCIDGVRKVLRAFRR